jgi:hypothetical protein
MACNKAGQASSEAILYIRRKEKKRATSKEK